jgi:hypothetical protein
MLRLLRMLERVSYWGEAMGAEMIKEGRRYLRAYFNTECEPLRPNTLG